MKRFIRFSFCAVAVAVWSGCADITVIPSDRSPDPAVSFETASTTVFQQDFTSSTSLSSFIGDPASAGQFNDISSEATGGTWSIDQGRLKLARIPSSTPDHVAGITRWTDFVGPPSKLHITFDLGVFDWTTSQFQSGAMFFSVGAISRFSSYENGEVATNTFHTISVKGEGSGQFSVMSATAKSELFPADGTLRHISLFLNKSGAAASYRAPDGTLRTLQNNGAALWVGSAAVVANDAALNGAASSLTDLRIHWDSPADGTWLLDNFFIESTFPQTLPP